MNIASYGEISFFSTGRTTSFEELRFQTKTKKQRKKEKVWLNWKPFLITRTFRQRKPKQSLLTFNDFVQSGKSLDYFYFDPSVWDIQSVISLQSLGSSFRIFFCNHSKASFRIVCQLRNNPKFLNLLQGVLRKNLCSKCSQQIPCTWCKTSAENSNNSHYSLRGLSSCLRFFLLPHKFHFQPVMQSSVRRWFNSNVNNKKIELLDIVKSQRRKLF